MPTENGAHIGADVDFESHGGYYGVLPFKFSIKNLGCTQKKNV